MDNWKDEFELAIWRTGKDGDAAALELMRVVHDIGRRGVTWEEVLKHMSDIGERV